MATNLETLLVQFRVDNNKLSSGLDKSQKDINGFTSNAASSFKKMAIGVAAAYAVIKSAQGIADVIIKFEKLEASLRTVTGSADKAATAFNRLKEFARTTPFQLDEVIASFIKMKALGLDPSEAALRSYGNTATAMGRSLNQLIEAVSDASVGEYERLKEFGIKAKSQSDAVTFTFQGITTKVGKNAKEIQEYLKGIGDVQFAGAMEEQEDTLNVATSNMSASFEDLAKTIGDLGVTALFAEIANDVTSLVNATVDLIKATDQYIERLQELQANAANDTYGALFANILGAGQTNDIGMPIANFPEGQTAESIAAAFEEKKALLEEQKQIELDIEKAFQEDVQAAVAEHYSKLRDLDVKRQADAILFEKMTNKEKGVVIAKGFSDIIGIASQNNRALFEIQKVAAAAQVLLNTPESISNAYNWGLKVGGPAAPLVAAAAAATAGAAQLAQLNAIRGTTFGGGGSAGGGAGNSGAIGAAQSQGAEQQAPTIQQNVLDVTISASGGSNVDINQIIAAINEAQEGGGAVIRGIRAG